jgi:hypothetical protein
MADGFANNEIDLVELGLSQRQPGQQPFQEAKGVFAGPQIAGQGQDQAAPN